MRFAVCVVLAALVLPATAHAKDVPNQGMTSKVHQKNVGKVVFKTSPVDFKKPDPKSWTTRFNWPGPIYSRAYLPHSMAVEYAKRGFDTSKGYHYVLNIALNGKDIYTKFMTIKPDWSTFQVGLSVKPEDERKYFFGRILSFHVHDFKVGKNTIDISFFAKSGDKKSPVLARGSFDVSLTQAQHDEAVLKHRTLRGYRVKDLKAKGAREAWNITWGNGTGTLTVEKPGHKDSWKRWTFQMPHIKGRVQTGYKGGGGQPKWLLHAGFKAVDMEATGKGKDAWKSWKLISGRRTWTLTTTKERPLQMGNWTLKGPDGSVLFSNEFGDNSRNVMYSVRDQGHKIPPEVKIAALFLTINAGPMK